jgi:hypothetical protein
MNCDIIKSCIWPWLIKNCFNIIFTLILCVGGYLLWNNTRPQEPKAIQELIQTIKDNSKPVIEKSTSVIPSKIDESLKHYTIIKIDDFENALKAVALVSRQEATEDYHKSFSILVAMLALFGIGFPVIVAFIQHRFNERELDNIKEATKQSKDANIKAQKAIIKANSSLDENEKIKTSIWQNQYNAYRELAQIYQSLSTPCTYDNDNLTIIYYVKACLLSAKGSYVILQNNKNLEPTFLKNNVLGDMKIDMDNIKDSLSNISKYDINVKVVLHYIFTDIKHYQDILDNILKIVPANFHTDINDIKIISQKVLKDIQDIIKSLP